MALSDEQKALFINRIGTSLAEKRQGAKQQPKLELTQPSTEQQDDYGFDPIGSLVSGARQAEGLTLRAGQGLGLDTGERAGELLKAAQAGPQKQFTDLSITRPGEALAFIGNEVVKQLPLQAGPIAGAIGGAAMGAKAGPWGAAAGALLGGAIGGYHTLFGEAVDEQQQLIDEGKLDNINVAAAAKTASTNALLESTTGAILTPLFKPFAKTGQGFLRQLPKTLAAAGGSEAATETAQEIQLMQMAAQLQGQDIDWSSPETMNRLVNTAGTAFFTGLTLGLIGAGTHRTNPNEVSDENLKKIRATYESSLGNVTPRTPEQVQQVASTATQAIQPKVQGVDVTYEKNKAKSTNKIEIKINKAAGIKAGLLDRGFVYDEDRKIFVQSQPTVQPGAPLQKGQVLKEPETRAEIKGTTIEEPYQTARDSLRTLGIIDNVANAELDTDDYRPHLVVSKGASIDDVRKARGNKGKLKLTLGNYDIREGETFDEIVVPTQEDPNIYLPIARVKKGSATLTNAGKTLIGQQSPLTGQVAEFNALSYTNTDGTRDVIGLEQGVEQDIHNADKIIQAADNRLAEGVQNINEVVEPQNQLPPLSPAQPISQQSEQSPVVSQTIPKQADVESQARVNESLETPTVSAAALSTEQPATPVQAKSSSPILEQPELETQAAEPLPYTIEITSESGQGFNTVNIMDEQGNVLLEDVEVPDDVTDQEIINSYKDELETNRQLEEFVPEEIVTETQQPRPIQTSEEERNRLATKEADTVNRMFKAVEEQQEIELPETQPTDIVRKDGREFKDRQSASSALTKLNKSNPDKFPKEAYDIVEVKAGYVLRRKEPQQQDKTLDEPTRENTTYTLNGYTLETGDIDEGFIDIIVFNPEGENVFSDNIEDNQTPREILENVIEGENETAALEQQEQEGETLEIDTVDFPEIQTQQEPEQNVTSDTNEQLDRTDLNNFLQGILKGTGTSNVTLDFVSRDDIEGSSGSYDHEDRIISISDDLTYEQANEVVAHEASHAIVKDHFSNSSVETQIAVLEDYFKWLKGWFEKSKNTKKDRSAFVSSLNHSMYKLLNNSNLSQEDKGKVYGRFVQLLNELEKTKSKGKTPINELVKEIYLSKVPAVMREKYKNESAPSLKYATSFEEWMADKGASYFTATEQGTSLVGKFFKDLSTKLYSLYSKFVTNPVPQSVQNFYGNLVFSVNSDERTKQQNAVNGETTALKDAAPVTSTLDTLKQFQVDGETIVAYDYTTNKVFVKKFRDTDGSVSNVGKSLLKNILLNNGFENVTVDNTKGPNYTLQLRAGNKDVDALINNSDFLDDIKRVNAGEFIDEKGKQSVSKFQGDNLKLQIESQVLEQEGKIPEQYIVEDTLYKDDLASTSDKQKWFEQLDYDINRFTGWSQFITDSELEWVSPEDYQAYKDWKQGQKEVQQHVVNESAPDELGRVVINFDVRDYKVKPFIVNNEVVYVEILDKENRVIIEDIQLHEGETVDNILQSKDILEQLESPDGNTDGFVNIPRHLQRQPDLRFDIRNTSFKPEKYEGYVANPKIGPQLSLKSAVHTFIGGGISKVQAYINDLVTTHPVLASINIVPVQSQDELPSTVQVSKRSFIEGAYDPYTGKIYIVVNNISSQARLEQVLAHESIGHYGVEIFTSYLDNLLGKEQGSTFNEIIAKVKETAKATKPITQPITNVNDPNYATMEAVRVEYKFLEQTNPDIAERVYAMEVIARVAEQRANVSWFNELIRNIKVAVGKIFPSWRPADQDIVDLLKDTTKFLRNPQNKNSIYMESKQQQYLKEELRRKRARETATYIQYSDGIKRGRVAARAIIAEWARMTGITNVQLMPPQMAEQYKIKRGTSLGLTTKVGDTWFIYLRDDTMAALGMKPKINKDTILQRMATEVLGHEFGHVVSLEKFSALRNDSQLKQAVRNEFATWLRSKGKEPTQEDIVDMYFARMQPITGAVLSTQYGLTGKHTSLGNQYILDFQEWMADQIGAYLVNDINPQSPVQQFFKDIADSIKQIIQMIERNNPLTTSVREFMDNVLKNENAYELPILLSAKDTNYSQDNEATINKLVELGSKNLPPSSFREWARKFKNRQGTNLNITDWQRLGTFYNSTVSSMQNLANQSRGFRAVLGQVNAMTIEARNMISEMDNIQKLWNPTSWKHLPGVGEVNGRSRKYQTDVVKAGTAVTMRQMLGATLTGTQIGQYAASLLTLKGYNSNPLPMGKRSAEFNTPKFEINESVFEQLLASGVLSKEVLQSITQIQVGEVVRKVTDQFKLSDDQYEMYRQWITSLARAYAKEAQVAYAARYEKAQRDIYGALSQIGLYNEQPFIRMRMMLRDIVMEINRQTIERKPINPDDLYDTSLPNAVQRIRDEQINSLFNAIQSGQMDQSVLSIVEAAGVNKREAVELFKELANQQITEGKLNIALNGFNNALRIHTLGQNAILKAANQIATGFSSTRRFGKHSVTLKFTDDKGKVIAKDDIHTDFQNLAAFMRFENYTEAQDTLKDLNSEVSDLKLNILMADGSTREVGVTAQYKVLSEIDHAPNRINVIDLIEANDSAGIFLTANERKTLIRKLVSADNKIARRLLKRNNFLGESKDYERVLAANSTELAYSIASKKYMPRVNDIIADPDNVYWSYDQEIADQLKLDIREAKNDAARTIAQQKYEEYQKLAGNERLSEAYRDEAKRLADFISAKRGAVADDTSWNTVKSTVAIMQLGGSIASAAIQVTQLGLATMPYLAFYSHKNSFGGGFGMGAVVKQMVSSVAVASKVIGGFKGDVPTRIQNLVKNKTLTTDEANFLIKEFNGGVIQAAHKNALMGAATGKWGNSSWRELLDKYMILFSKVEEFNRISTALTAYRLFKSRANMAGQSNNQAQAYAEQAAVQTIYNTQGNYDMANRQPWARDGFKGVLMMYKMYPVVMFELLKSMPPWGRAWTLGWLAVSSGLQGIPFAEDMEDILNGLMRFFNITPGSTKGLVDGMVDKHMKMLTGIDEASSYFRHGLLDAVSGLSIGERIGLGDMLPGTEAMKKGTGWAGFIDELLGPAGGAAENMGRFIDAIKSHGLTDIRTARAIPLTGTRNIFEGMQMMLDGQASDYRNYKVTDVDTWDSVARIIGFQPAQKQEQYENLGAYLQATELRNSIRQSYMADLVTAAKNKDNEEVRSLFNELEDWNKHARYYGIEVKITNQQLNDAIASSLMELEQRYLQSAPLQLRNSPAY